ncbi:MAG: response regulator, partial [Cyanobacteria bacterium J06642_2]
MPLTLPQSTVITSDRATLLVVDDTPANLSLLNQCLKQRGYQTRCALSGKLALDYLESHRPDLILLDILMPEMNGYEVCTSIKNNAATADIPIIFISAIDEAFDKVKAFSAGGTDYITKPFQIEEVYARIEHQLTIKAQHKKIQIQNHALTESNERLKYFANILAHDLKQPIQSI